MYATHLCHEIKLEGAIRLTRTTVVLSLLGSAILLLMILFKYVHSRRNLQTWNVLYGNAASLTSSNAHSSKSRSIWLGSSGGGRSRAYSGAGANNTYDSWLVIRLSIAFAVLWYVLPDTTTYGKEEKG